VTHAARTIEPGSAANAAFRAQFASGASTPKLALDDFAGHMPAMGICKRFHDRDPRVDDAAAGLCAAAFGRSDRRADALENMASRGTFRFTPEHLGLAPRHISAPIDAMQSADLCARTTERHAPAQRGKAA